GIIIYFFSFYFVSISILSALLLAAILTPTDPVSVVSVLKTSSNNPDIANIVDGESMINDGTSIVLFTVILDMYTRNESFHFFVFIKSFLFFFFVGFFLSFFVGLYLIKLVILLFDRFFYI